jgi:hypothetical protein
VLRSQLYEALRSSTEGDYALVGELDADQGWMAYLAVAHAGSPAILLLHQTEDGDQFDLQVVDALDGSLAVGRTHCPACGTTADGWPRFCAGCRRDLSGVAADSAVPGGAADELLQAVREASAGVYEVLGALPHREGGGAMYFAREVEGGRIAGLVLEREGNDELSLVRSWGADEAALAGADAAPGAHGRPWQSPAAPAVDAAALADATLPDATLPAPKRPDPAPADPPTADARRYTGVLDPPIATNPPADVPWMMEPVPPPANRGPSRRVLYAIAGVLLLAAGGALAFALVARDPSAIPPVAVADSLQRAPAAPVPAAVAVPTWITDSARVDSAASAPASEPALAVPPARPRPRPRRQAEPAPAPRTEPPPPAGPSPETDRQRVRDAVARYADAVQSRDLARVRGAYPGISAEETERWADWFSRFGAGDRLAVSQSISRGPDVEGDRATIVFTLTLRYQGQRHPVTSRGTLRRAGDGWVLQELRAP